MATRRSFKCIGLGVLGSFVSRNNDVDGYWALGKICSLLLANNTSKASVDLINKVIDPASAEFDSMLKQYSEKLYTIMSKFGFEKETAIRAEIQLTLSPADQYPLAYPTTDKYCLESKISITDDRGRIYTMKSTPTCNPYDPAIHFRSGRVNY